MKGGNENESKDVDMNVEKKVKIENPEMLETELDELKVLIPLIFFLNWFFLISFHLLNKINLENWYFKNCRIYLSKNFRRNEIWDFRERKKCRFK